jgi:hypothetical protein
MKGLQIILLTGFAGLAFCLAFWFRSEIASKNQASGAYCNEDRYSYGRVKDLTDMTLQHVFPIKNTSQHTIVITKILTSCGCLVASGGDGAIEPGGTVDIPTRLSIADTVGVKRAHILLLFEDGSTKRLDVSANIPDQILTFPPHPAFTEMKNELKIQLIRKTLYDSNNTTNRLTVLDENQKATFQIIFVSHKEKVNHDTIVHNLSITIPNTQKNGTIISLVAVYGDGFKVPLSIPVE